MSPAAPKEPVGCAAIEQALQRALSPTVLEVIDESASHAGHSGSREGGHYRVRIVSAAFEGRSKVERHRLVYDALRELFPLGIHALALQAHSPSDRNPHP